MKDSSLQELRTLFFTTRQMIRAELPQKKACDPNEWLHSEVLRFVSVADGPTMLDIAQHLCVKAPSATSLISTLVTAGWLERKGSSEDRRVVKIYITKAGQKRLEKYITRSTTMMHKVFSKLSEDEILALVTILRRVQKVPEKNR